MYTSDHIFHWLLAFSDLCIFLYGKKNGILCTVIVILDFWLLTSVIALDTFPKVLHHFLCQQPTKNVYNQHPRQMSIVMFLRYFLLISSFLSLVTPMFIILCIHTWSHPASLLFCNVTMIALFKLALFLIITVSVTTTFPANEWVFSLPFIFTWPRQ